MKIRNIVGIVAVIIFAACWAGCGLTSSDRCPDGEVCGDGCMPTDADCCSNGEYCPVGSTCTADDMCYTSGGGGGGGGGDPSDYDGGYTSNCYCPGDLQCSQLVACVQSCTCYYTINGSDGMSAWYLVRESYSDTGACYMCDQVGLGVNCDSAAQAAANAAIAECF